MKRFLAFLALSSFAAVSFAADHNQAVTDLIPKLADADVAARSDAQMQLQQIASESSKPGHAAEREALGKVLAAKAADSTVPQPARVWIVRQLEYMGGAEAVSAITQLLNGNDAELRECARRALEKNSAPAASDSLRAALEKATDTAWRIGLVNALGWRGDTASVGLLAKQLDDAAVGSAAALALGRIADSASVQALWAASPRRASVGDGLVLAVNKLLAQGNTTAAKVIAQKVQGEAGSSALKAAALSVLAKADPAAAPQLISDALTGADAKVQQAALAAAVSLYGKDFTSKLAPLFPKLGAGAKIQLLALVDASAEPQVIAATADADESVRRAALESLGRIGSAASVPVLLAAATEDAKPGKSTAEAALRTIPGNAAAAVIEAAASQGEAKLRVAALNALGGRKQTSALPTLFHYTTDADSAVRKAAYSALRSMAADAEIEPLAKLVLTGKAEAAAALEAAAQRANDKPAAVKTLLALAGSDDKTLAALLEPLAVLGGDDALAAVVKLTKNADADTQDEAVRALGSWTDIAAARPLLDLASSPDAKPNQHLLALQGLMRLVKSVETEPTSRRADLAITAMKSARDDGEKKLVLSGLGAVPHRKTADAIKPFLTDAALKKEACAAGISLAEALVRTDRNNAKALATAVKDATTDQGIQRRVERVLSR
ncbi:MAG: HEAT repeat domain-containing protein [Verrucomicrobia bacterium]|nr:HEAT repeat domain-containing protein [Verrucomicrobiota bacterium]